MPVISVIIPVYNCEKWLRQCVDSVLGQRFRDLELILIDDGSTDSSAEICVEYAAADSRVKLLRGRNRGAGAARNMGLDAAQCEYVLFVDSDDYIEQGSLGQIMEANAADGACDVVFLKGTCEREDGSRFAADTVDRSGYYGETHDYVLEHLARHDPLPVCVWGKLLRRRVLEEHGIRFTEGIICEDVDFCIALYMCAETYNYIDEMYYYYRVGREGSVMTVNAERKYHSLYIIVSKWAELAKTRYAARLRELHMILAFQYCMLLPMYRSLPKAERKTERVNAASYAYLLGCSPDMRVRLVNLSRKVMGFNAAATLLWLYNRLK